MHSRDIDGVAMRRAVYIYKGCNTKGFMDYNMHVKENMDSSILTKFDILDYHPSGLGKHYHSLI